MALPGDLTDDSGSAADKSRRNTTADEPKDDSPGSGEYHEISTKRSRFLFPGTYTPRAPYHVRPSRPSTN
jgi:hypothetical protein